MENIIPLFGKKGEQPKREDRENSGDKLMKQMKMIAETLKGLADYQRNTKKSAYSAALTTLKSYSDEDLKGQISLATAQGVQAKPSYYSALYKVVLDRRGEMFQNTEVFGMFGEIDRRLPDLLKGAGLSVNFDETIPPIDPELLRDLRNIMEDNDKDKDKDGDGDGDGENVITLNFGKK